MPRSPNKCYSHSIPGGLPRQVTFKAAAGEESLLTNMVYIEEEHIPAVFSLTRQAAEAGLNVGLDEYETEDTLIGVLDSGPAFVLLDRAEAGGGSIVGALLIPPSMLQRSFRAHTCEFKIILSPGLQQVDGFRIILRLAEGLLDEMPELLYDSAVVSIFAPNYEYMKILREEKYYPTLIMPQNGWVTGINNPQDCVVYYKDIRENIPVRSMLDMGEVLSLFQKYETFDIASQSASIPYLPVRHVFKNGKELIIRNCRSEEDKPIYECVKGYAERGEGYSTDDVPTLNVFRGYYLQDHYIAVMEEPTSEETVGYLIMGESDVARSCREKLLADTSLMIHPKYQSQGFGRELLEVGLGIMKDLGFLGMLSDLLISNLAMFNVTTRLGYSKCGFSPKGCYVEGEGWMDAIFTYKDFRKERSFINDMYKPSSK